MHYERERLNRVSIFIASRLGDVAMSGIGGAIFGEATELALNDTKYSVLVGAIMSGVIYHQRRNRNK